MTSSPLFRSAKPFNGAWPITKGRKTTESPNNTAVVATSSQFPPLYRQQVKSSRNKLTAKLPKVHSPFFFSAIMGTAVMEAKTSREVSTIKNQSSVFPVARLAIKQVRSVMATTINPANRAFFLMLLV